MQQAGDRTAANSPIWAHDGEAPNHGDARPAHSPAQRCRSHGVKRPGFGPLLLTFMAAFVVSAAASASTFDEQGFTRQIQRALSDWQVPGAAVAVIDQGSMVFARGFGHTGHRDSPAVGRDTYFINASTTKAMVAAGLLILADEELLRLDDAVVDYIPELRLADPALTTLVTLRDLLAHRTGLPSTDFWTFNQGMPLLEQLPRLRHVEPVAPPRTRKIYQNTMYELAGLVIERVSGRPWQEFLAERLWRPIGMSTVATRDAIPSGLDRAEPFDVFDGKLRRVNHSLRGHVADAAGSAWSTLDDMILWLEFLLRGGVTESGERLLSEQAIEAMFTPQQLIATEDYYPTAELTRPQWISYGLGWYQQDFLGRKVDYHTGSLNGAVAIAGLDRARGRGVVVLANRGGAEFRHAVLWSVMDERRGDARPDWHQEVLDLYQSRAAEREARNQETDAGRLAVATSLPLRAYAGRYDSPQGGPIEIVVEGEQLRLHTQVREYRLQPWHADIFALSHADWKTHEFAHFHLTAAGAIDAVEAFGIRFERRVIDAIVAE